jgi:hypothetical protein
VNRLTGTYLKIYFSLPLSLGFGILRRSTTCIHVGVSHQGRRDLILRQVLLSLSFDSGTIQIGFSMAGYTGYHIEIQTSSYRRTAMKNSSKYMLIAGGIAPGLAGGITIGVTEADDIKGMANMPQEFLLMVAGTDTQQPITLMEEIISRFEQDGSRVTGIKLDREYMRDIYELELIDTSGKEWEIDVDARTGEIIKKKRD